MKNYFTLLLTFVILFPLSFTVSAHPGRTDSNGGHYDRSTGEYHYHTGEYSDREQSSSSSSDDAYYPDWRKYVYEISMFQDYGKEEGLKQLCIDSIYKLYFGKGFQDALSEYSKSHPIFSFIVSDNDKDILYYDFYHFNNAYDQNLDNSFYRYYSSKYHNSRNSLKNAFSHGYDLSYFNENYEKAPSSYKLSSEAEKAREKGYEDGYNQFYDGNLYAYKETYPFEAFFSLMSSAQIIIVSVIFFLVVIFTIRFILKHCKNKHRKSIVYVYDIDIPTSNTPQEISSEEKILFTDNKSTYKSLIPEFVPPDNTDKEFLVVGVDIPDDFTYFTPIIKNKNAYVKIITEGGTERYDYIISQDKQYITLMKGEKIKLINCYYDRKE